MSKTISLEFNKGYYREVNKGGIPNEAGIYLVYVCRYNKQTDKVTLDKLIYIGEAEEVNDRISEHEKWEEWREKVPNGSEICFSFAGITTDRERAECALIFYHKPDCNEECKKSFPYEETTVISKGNRCALIESPITVKKTTQ